MNTKCERCRKKLDYWYEHSGTITFYGGVTLKVCTACRSELQDRIQSHALWTEVYDLDAQLTFLQAAAVSGDDTQERLRAVYARKLEIIREFSKIVREWVPVVEEEATADDD